jgi:hypothetical protein
LKVSKKGASAGTAENDRHKQSYSMELELQARIKESAYINPFNCGASKEQRGISAYAVKGSSLEFQVVEGLEGYEDWGQGHAGCRIYKADAVLQRSRGQKD